jgi:hypothetical protein
MPTRTERRAAEHAARKLAYKQSRNQPSQTQQVQTQSQLETAAEPAFETPFVETSVISEAQLAANRANAQLSTGPVTSEGKAKSSMNALKHGLTSQTVLLPHEDAAQYRNQLEIYADLHAPATEEELRLVQSLVDSNWRLNRVHRVEAGIQLKGQLEFAAKYADRPPIEREHLIEAEAYLKYEKSLRNLQIQETRLRRTIDKDKAELQRLQTLRKREERLVAEANAQAAAAAAKAQQNQSQTRSQSATANSHSKDGFVFASAPNQPANSTPDSSIGGRE